MFENSLLSSTQSRGTGRLRWFVAASVVTQGLLVAALLVLPLLWPAVLPVVAAAAPRVTAVTLRPLPKPQPVKPVQTTTPTTTAIHAPSAPAATVATVRSGATIARATSTPAIGDAPTLSLGPGMGEGFSAIASISAGPGGGTGAVVRAATSAPAHATGPVRISTGVSAGLLLTPIRPVYPAIAKASHTEGTVLLTATIGRDGRIANLAIVSGPPMLRNAALEAVQAARYRPFLLNGETTEVITSISVVFTLNG